MEKRDPKEIAMQSAAFTNLWNERPDLRGRIFAINNNSQNAIKGAINKAMGVIPGVSDMAFLCSSGCIVWIEWKTEKGTQSKEQREWQSTISVLGHIYVIVRSEHEFRKLIDSYSHMNAI